MATLEGRFHRAGRGQHARREDGLEEFGYEAGGKKIELITGSSDASPDSAIRATRKLVEQDGVQVLVGPLSGSEGLAVKDYAKTQPDVTFLNGTSAAQDTTLRNPADNFFRFSTDGAQWMAGLGEYVYNEKGYRSSRGSGRGLLLSLHAGLRLPRALLPARRQGAHRCALLGADRQQGLLLGDRRASR